ncbi:NAD(P)H:quinone oxidoreductase [Aliidiomarina taiwanensis]|uniref:NAD(P)H dehydrogenase (quinone) n=1 Tax=Aliidiomarina taiwanensis TaxID=946228 RepID=A0A432X1N1_9GAMM|nr:NAD(P)H:quinone oxidoreductase [Aliidiomarina taiwanensis]RUO40460.1 NAD(P)H:quinone oxidoreductase [Aliidiomarina taiwanensis]
MAKVLVLYYSSYGHIESMAQAVAEGAQQGGADVDIMRVPELVPEDVMDASGYKKDQAAPVAKPADLARYDAVIFGTPTRFGMMASQMKNFLDQCGSLWANGSLVGKVGGVFTSTGTQHGGQEATLLNFHTVLLHFGFVVSGLPYSFTGQTRMDEITGGTPYGASTIAGADNSRQPSDNELDGARFQGEHIAKLAAKLAG